MFKSKELLVPYSKGLETTYFWKMNLSVMKGDDELLFPMLNDFFSYLFVLPHSSASVERVFSSISLNKTKIRNRLSTKTLSGLLHSKQLIKSNDKDCFDYDITDQLLEKLNNSIYT